MTVETSVGKAVMTTGENAVETVQSVWDAESVGTELLACEDEVRDRTPFSDEWPELATDTALAYAIQDQNLARRLARGETLIGIKLGVTSRAKQAMVGIDSPGVAWLTDAMVLPAGDPIPQDKLIHPRVEPEIVFVMKDRLEGPGVTAAQAMAAVGSVLGGVEIIDSRYRDFRFRIGDVIADNNSSGRFTTGPVSVPPDRINLAAEAVLVEVNGEIVDSATGAAIQDHPGEALALAVNVLAERGLALEPGWIVLTGGITTAWFAPPGTSVGVHFTTLGSIYAYSD
ncbi:2-oxo-3-hexenedioate decarboxylase [Raineyella antarctica]|uniref:2-oxo-3-hexenedioate decarboxylase n=1 Tax=Raineyella antarctica TaxID=1577474 RepID=A0A1G6GIG4_9ACTN|nr:fumarylacetoacetate hydrolase family protein [Raineyella antarctica]SDB81623.1 2-oxo-3-hexenedioate decarboxylase [Raineyella antarctica]